jgi:hypothetical protein
MPARPCSKLCGARERVSSDTPPVSEGPGRAVVPGRTTGPDVTERPCMGSYRYTQSAALSAERVFDYLADVRNLPRYLPSMTAAEPEGGDQVHVAAKGERRPARLTTGYDAGLGVAAGLTLLALLLAVTVIRAPSSLGAPGSPADRTEPARAAEPR